MVDTRKNITGVILDTRTGTIREAYYRPQGKVGFCSNRGNSKLCSNRSKILVRVYKPIISE
jgi:hypothetical protein